MTTLSQAARRLVVAEFVVAAAVITYAGLHDVRGVLFGAPRALSVPFTATCEAIEHGSPCRVAVTELWGARYRAATDVAAAAITIAVEPSPAAQHARHLLIGVAQPAIVRVGNVRVGAGRRAVVRYTGGSIGVEPDGSAAAAPIVVAELGFFESNRGLLSDVRPLFDPIPAFRYHTTLVPRAIALLCLFTMLAAFWVPPAWLRRANPPLLAVVCFSLCLIDLAILYSPYTGRDLRAYYASGPLQEIAGSNLNGAIWEASRLMGGQGFTVADGLVSWAKMPGYGLFAALAGILFGHRTFVDLVMATILGQILFYCGAVAFFAWAAGRLWRPAVVWTVGLLVAMLPKQLGYTQVDSVITPVALLILGALCIRLDAEEHGRPIGVGVDLGVHLGFALWFLMRPDILPAWAIVSLVLHARQRTRLAMPLVLAAAIGVGWATYKMRYTGEFVPTTSTTGASLLCGLWEVPSRFPWVCSDESYFAWVAAHTTFDTKSQAGSSVVVREVIKFWVTYPGHFVLMVYNKAMRCLTGDLWPGIPTDLQQSIFQIVKRSWLILVMLTAIVLSVATAFRRRRTLLLAWPLLLNAPVFWILQTSEGRYYGGVGAALLVSAVPLLLDPDFYGALGAERRTALTVLASVAFVAAAAWPVHDWLLRSDAFHYWTPFLDPSSASWGLVK